MMPRPGMAADRADGGRPDVTARVYRVLLRAYPPSFRAAYGREMTLLFRDQLRDSGASAGVAFWIAVLWDVARSAPVARAEVFRARRAGHTRNGGAIMRPMSMLAMLVGTADVLNALIEARAGWASQGGAAWLSSIAAAVIAGILIIAVGIAMLRRPSSSSMAAGIAAAVCLAMVASAQALHPWMSTFARLIGFGFPIVLGLFLLTTRRGGPSALAS